MDRPALLVENRPGDARLLASEHPEAEWERRGEVLAREMEVDGEVALLALRAVAPDRRADVADQAALVGDDEVPARAQDARELAEWAVEVRQVHERDRADDEVDGFVRERQLVQVGLVELALRDLLACEREHPR
ncbi:MAG TPA: hypothetical protein VNI55_06630 [Gaiellaceae bacterium]|nr:hypothetical protein [Gaiellaceae bacterium]